VVLKPCSHCVWRRTSTHSARTHVDVGRHVAVRRCAAMYGAVRRRRTLQMLKLYATYHYLLRRRRNTHATTDSNATYDAVYVIAAIEVDYNVAVLV